MPVACSGAWCVSLALPPAPGTFQYLDATSSIQTQLNGKLTTSIPFCNGFTPAAGQAVEYSTSLSPNPCWTAVTPPGSSYSGTQPVVITGSSIGGPDIATANSRSAYLAPSYPTTNLYLHVTGLDPSKFNGTTWSDDSGNGPLVCIGLSRIGCPQWGCRAWWRGVFDR